MKPLNFEPPPPWVEHRRKQAEERFRKELESDPVLRILHKDNERMPYIGMFVNIFGHSYYKMIIDYAADGLLKTVVQRMQATNIPQHLWAQMQDMGVDDVGLHVAMHNIQYEMNVDRSNWVITADTLLLLELTYKRGRGIGVKANEQRLAYEAYREGDHYEVCKHATLDQKVRIAEVFRKSTVNEEKHYDS